MKKIPKGRGFLYVHDNQLYQRVKTKNDHTLYLKCYLLTLSHCDGSTFCMLFFTQFVILVCFCV